MTPIMRNSLAHMFAVRCCQVAVSGLLATVAIGAAAGCSSLHQSTPASSPASASSASTQSGSLSGLSPGGVTTSMSAEPGLTEEEYWKACSAARDWMKSIFGDMHNQIEPYLSLVQA